MYVVILYKSETCPHCIKLKPAWAEFVQKLLQYNSTISSLDRKTSVIVMDNQINRGFVTAMGVRGFPTIAIYKFHGGDAEIDTANLELIETYHGDRTSDDIMHFVRKSTASYI